MQIVLANEKQFPDCLLHYQSSGHFIFREIIMRKHIPAIYRVLEKIQTIPESGCWIYMGALNEAGYGIAGLGSRGSGVERTHRISYSHFIGEIPEGMFVCHKCDVRSCCNPAHLFLGTNHDNVKDMIAKKRNSKPPENKHIKGTVHVLHKLNDQAVREIRELRGSGKTLAFLSNAFGVCDSVIYKICARRSWRHVS